MRRQADSILDDESSAMRPSRGGHESQVTGVHTGFSRTIITKRCLVYLFVSSQSASLLVGIYPNFSTESPGVCLAPNYPKRPSTSS